MDEEGGAHQALKSAGAMLRRPGFDLLGQWATHIYKSELTGQIIILTQHKVSQIAALGGGGDQIVLKALEETQRSLQEALKGKRK